MDQDFRTFTEKATFGVRATALIVRHHKLLLVKDQNNNYYPIGGAVLVGEKTEDAVLRETLEELGIQADVQKLAFIAENHFLKEGVYWHLIEFHYLVKPLEEPDLIMTENTRQLNCEWIDIDCLHSINLVPEFLKDCLPNWSGKIEHVYNKS